MSILYERILRPLLFRMEAEQAHEIVTSLLSLSQNLPGAPFLLSWSLGRNAPDMKTEAFGLKFPNPLGLAAGFDKDGRLSKILPALGFGFLELGSVTLRPQAGNPAPRLFRVPEAEALINRMGFNSAGAEAAARRLKASGRCAVPVGLNLGLNADCPKEQAPEEYAQAFHLLEPYGDYFALNVSSPNTTGLRDLQENRRLEKILAAIRLKNRNKKPVLVKISPDLSDDALPDLLSLIQSSASGIIVSNTTTSRNGLHVRWEREPGGLSGKPLCSRSTALIGEIHRLTQGKLPIIGVGGIFSGKDAFEKIRAGATLVQIYTGLVYRGPAAARAILAELAEEMAA